MAFPACARLAVLAAMAAPRLSWASRGDGFDSDRLLLASRGTVEASYRGTGQKKTTTLVKGPPRMPVSAKDLKKQVKKQASGLAKQRAENAEREKREKQRQSEAEAERMKSGGAPKAPPKPKQELQQPGPAEQPIYYVLESTTKRPPPPKSWQAPPLQKDRPPPPQGPPPPPPPHDDLRVESGSYDNPHSHGLPIEAQGGTESDIYYSEPENHVANALLEKWLAPRASGDATAVEVAPVTSSNSFDNPPGRGRYLHTQVALDTRGRQQVYPEVQIHRR